MAKNSSEPRDYRVVRFFFKAGRQVLDERLTLSEAQAHCRDPETSSRTCSEPNNTARTMEHGPWFDGYEQY